MISKQILGTGVACLAIAGTGVGVMQYQNTDTVPNPENGQEDPLAKILGKKAVNNLAGDFTTTETLNRYAGPISETLQKCLDTPLTAAEKEDETVYAPFNRRADINQTRDEILADIGPVLGHAVQNNEINWKWDGLSKTYKFKGHEDDAKLWYCYFKEDSPFFQEFLDQDKISVPMNDVSTVSFTEILPEPAPDGGFKHSDSQLSKFNMTNPSDIQKFADLKDFEDGFLSKITTKFAKEGAKFDKFASFAKFDQDLISPKLGSLDFWDEIEKQKTQTQKVVKISPEENAQTVISLGGIEIDTTKEFSVSDLEQELKDKVKFEKITDPDTGREKVLVKLSEATTDANANVDSYIESIKLKEVGDTLATLLDENAEAGKVDGAVATFEIVATLADNVPAGTQYQAVIQGAPLTDVLNENGQTLANPIDEPIYSEIIEIDGAQAPTCSNATPVCGVESIEEAAEAGHELPQLKTYASKCEFNEAGADYFDAGSCDADDEKEHTEDLKDYIAE